MTNAELRKIAYSSFALIYFNGEMITFDEAGKFHNSYTIVEDFETANYLKEEMKKAKQKIKEMYP